MEIQLSKVVQNYIDIYQQNIKTNFPTIPVKDLQKIWKETTNAISEKSLVEEKKNGTKKKKTAYQNFFVVARQRLTEENQNLKFGEISKLVSTEWSNMTGEEKKRYETLNMNKEDTKSFGNGSFIDFFENPSEKESGYRFEFETDPTEEEESLIEDEIHEDDEEDDVYFDEENRFEMDD